MAQQNQKQNAVLSYTAVIAGHKVEGPLPILTSRDIGAIERCAEYLDRTPTFEDYQIYAKINTIDQSSDSRRNVVDYSKIDEKTKRKDLADKIKDDLLGSPSSTIVKMWHPQIKQDQVTHARRGHIFDVSVASGANLVEGRMREQDTVKQYLDWLNDAQSTVDTRKVTVLSTIPSRLNNTVFIEVVSNQIEQGNRLFEVIGAPLGSSPHAELNYSYINTQIPKALFIATEITNPNPRRKGSMTGPAPFRGMELVRDHGIWGICPRVSTPPDADYTAKTARRLDNQSGGFRKLNHSEYWGQYKSLDLGCDCPACAGKDADDFYGLHRSRNIYSALDAVHTAVVLPSLVKVLRRPIATEDAQLKSSSVSSGVSDEI